MNFRTFALFGSGGLWDALVGQEGVWGGFGEALGGFGEALGRLWEALGGFGEALGRLWEGFGKRPSVRPIYIKIAPTRNSRIIQLCWRILQIMKTFGNYFALERVA